MTLRPTLVDTDISRSLIFISFILLGFCLLFLNILTKFSACLTDNFFSIILLATNSAFFNPTKILACPAVSCWVSISFITPSGRVSNLKEFVI